MKFPSDASERIARMLLDGPATASDLAQRLGHAPAGVRRTLSMLVDRGLVQATDRPPYGPAPAPRRGRPSLVYSLTSAGRSCLGQGYDDLALQALRFLERSQGTESVRAFARERAERLLASRPLPVGDVSLTAPMIAEAFTEAGYAATVETPVDGGPAIQLCQHTCPVVDAAAQFPSLCEEETAAMSRAMGRHVTRLATLAKGDGVCTTVIPLEPAFAGGPVEADFSNDALNPTRKATT